ncbi:hypothetical protein MXB_5494 [Myxobolus squamalis]|nr:hypothetical protein MXB_5494 [Myxobolus squamalis]
MVADFSTNVSGNIYFLSYFDPIFKKTMLIGSLYTNGNFFNGDGFDWYIGSREFQPDDMDCSLTINDDQIFNPTNEVGNSSSCDSYDASGCIIGDMKGKHGKLILGQPIDWSNVRPFSLKDSNLPLDGINSIAWHAVYLVDKFNQEVVSCAVIKPIDEVKYKVLLKIPDLNENNVFGIVYFRQFSPYHSTYTKVRVKENDDFKMELKHPPVFALYDLFPNGVDCNAIGNIVTNNEGNVRLLVSSDYNNESVHEGVVEIGFITGFTLFGQKSILGQTVVAFKEFPKDTTPASCGQILPIKAEETIALIANFSSSNNITGYIFLTQYLYNKQYMQYSDTFIVAEVSNRNGYITKDHKYHIHQYPLQKDYLETDPALYCLSTGPHYNPYMVNVSQPNYDQECKIDFMKRCEVGDLNGKHGLGRSVVIHGEGKQKNAIACAKIEQFTR